MDFFRAHISLYSATLSPFKDSLRNTVVFMNILDLFLRMKDFVLDGVHSSVVCNPEMLLGSLILTMLKLRLAILSGDNVMLGVYLVNTIFHMAHIAFVFKFVPLRLKNALRGKCFVTGAAIGGLMWYSFQEDSRMLEAHMGYILLATIIINHAMRTLQKWNTQPQATPIWTLSLLMPITWIAYGIAETNILIVSQNALILAIKLMDRYRYRPHLSLRYALTFRDWRAAHVSRVYPSPSGSGTAHSLRRSSSSHNQSYDD
ncbi:GL13390 [Drosophila persimilis]|uniref:GL13390 n=1 Tax=Drosophila persimilis TaxID=7234 RepID=B4H362_DROPE|nr:GL13390 [Drosophila persimilis]